LVISLLSLPISQELVAGTMMRIPIHIVNNWMLSQFKNQGVSILDVFFCPHDPESNCNCRKPQPGMFNQANDKYGIDKKNSWMIGDKEADIKASNTAGIQNTILVKSGHEIDENNSNAKFILGSIERAKEVITN